MRARWPRAGLVVSGRYAARYKGPRKGGKEGTVRGVCSEWEGACADELCRGGRKWPPLMPETAILAQMQIVIE